jgi:glycosyltransferase involved in cell wall biosynthesis
MSATLVHHFGPDPDYVGGMGSVIRVLTEHRVGCDAVVSHPTWRPNTALASARLALAAAVDIVGTHRAEIVHVHLAQRGSFIREGGLVVFSRLRGRVTVATIHGSGFLAFARRHPRLVSWVLRRAAVITCLDAEVLAFVRELAPRAHIELMPNPVAISEESPAEETEEVVLFAGEIGLRKGVDVLCRAWEIVAAERPHARCMLVGPRRDFEVPPSERLEVLDPVAPAHMIDLLRSARVLALPSRAEAMPMALTEAMSAGRPFVSTPVGGIPELAREGGVLVEVGDHVALARALTDFLADPQLAAAVGERGRQFCRATRSVAVVDRQLRGLYETAARRHAAPVC